MPAPPAASKSTYVSPAPALAPRPTAMLLRFAPRRSQRNSASFAFRVSASGVAVALSLSVVDARAAEPARLEWVRLEGAGSCIDSAELEARVRRRLGTDPFAPRAMRRIQGLAPRTGRVWRPPVA